MMDKGVSKLREKCGTLGDKRRFEFTSSETAWEES